MEETALAILAIFIILPWMAFHYITKWKMSGTITNDDEALLEELYQVARRLEERMDNVERLVAAEDPEFRPGQALPESAPDEVLHDQLHRLRARKENR